MRQPLTARQQQALDYISSCLTERGYPPTLREIGEHMGIKSTNGVNDHLKALERKGYLVREELKSRALRPVDFEPEGSTEIKILGKVAAGQPILAQEDVLDRVRVDRFFLGAVQAKEVFGLVIQGDSMIEAGILDGDYIFVRKQQTAEQGETVKEHPATAVIDLLLNEYKRAGKAAGGGFYDYPEGAPKRLWPELKIRFETPEAQIAGQEIRDRLLFIQAIETVRCVEEGVLRSTADANIGSIYGIGFPAWTGGALQFINQYGLKDFIARAHDLAEHYGERFEPPALLLDKALNGDLF